MGSRTQEQALRQQHTIAESVSCHGVGLHSGASTGLTLEPAPAGHGIAFVLATDAAAAGTPVVIRSAPESVCSTSHATTLGREGTRVATVEHLLAALRTMHVDNARVVLDAAEVPAMDGSALAFTELLRGAGRVEQASPARALRVLRRVEVEDGLRRIAIEPSSKFEIRYAVDFDHPAIGRQQIEIPELDAAVFEREIAGARTFGFLREVGALWRAGLARGGSLENTVVLDDRRVINGEGLRWPDEFVRHKVLDLLGDLAVLGLSIAGRVTVERGGHGLHHALVRALLSNPEAWEISEVARSATGMRASAEPVSASPSRQRDGDGLALG